MTDSFVRRYLSFRYAGKKMPIRAGVVLRELKLRPRKLYMVDDENTAKAGLQSMGLFSYTNLQFVPRSTQVWTVWEMCNIAILWMPTSIWCSTNHTISM